MKKILISIIVFLIFLTFSSAETSKNQRFINYTVNWDRHEFDIEITNVLPLSDKSLPSLKSIIENNNKTDLPYIILSGIQKITINSKTKGAEYITEHPNTIKNILDLAPDFVKISSLFSLDFKFLVTTYSIDIYPAIAELFLKHSRTTKLTQNLNFVPSASFTGIVIYVDNNLPLYGKHSKGNYSPCLFPRIFNEQLDLIVDPLMVDPDIIKKEGTVGYQTSAKLLNIARVGNSPIKIKARGIFGINNTDLIISTRDSEKILSKTENLELIKQGKILIIYENNN